LINLSFSVFSSFICFRGLSSINKQIYHGMKYYVKGSYVSLAANFLLILLVLFFDERPREIWSGYFFIDLSILYFFSFLFKVKSYIK